MERNDTCWQKACKASEEAKCDTNFLYCGNQNMVGYEAWDRTNASVFCSGDGGDGHFDFGIFSNALQSGIVSKNNFLSKYCYCLWWGLQNLR